MALVKYTFNLSFSMEAILKNDHIVSYLYSGWESKDITASPVKMYFLEKYIPVLVRVAAKF